MSLVESYIMRDLPLQLDWDALQEKLRIRRGSKPEEMFRELARQAEALGNPKAAFKASKVTIINDGQVSLDSAVFQSGLLREKLTGLDQAFPFLATCGVELFEWARNLTGLSQVLADEIKIASMRWIRQELEDRILETYGLEQVSAMNPGSLQAWPLTEQRPLFAVMGPLADALGIELLPSLMMQPGQSSSGVFFKTETKYHNCQLCPRANCPGRRAPYTGLA